MNGFFKLISAGVIGFGVLAWNNDFDMRIMRMQVLDIVQQYTPFGDSLQGGDIQRSDGTRNSRPVQ
jgi:hypothetical protein